MKKINISLTLSLITISLVSGLAIGYYISPTYEQTMSQTTEMGLGKADRYVDLRYINAMAAHHKGAILLADQIQDKTKRQEIKKLVTDIQIGEPKLIAELMSWKSEWYDDTRVVKDPIVSQIGPSDDKSDLRFLNALIAHHENGIEMTREIRTKSSRAEILNNADAVEKFLTESLSTLTSWRSQWYGVN